MDIVRQRGTVIRAALRTIKRDPLASRLTDRSAKELASRLCGQARRDKRQGR